MRDFYDSYDQKIMDNDLACMLIKELSQIGFVDDNVSYKDDYDIFKIIDPQMLWPDISGFVSKELEEKYTSQKNLEPIISGQLSFYMGIYVAYLWINDNEKILTNVLNDKNWEINEEGKALYNFLGIDFECPFQVELQELKDEATDIDDFQKFFLKKIGLICNSDKEIELRGKINDCVYKYIVKCYEIADLYKYKHRLQIYIDAMTAMYKIGYNIGLNKFKK